MPLNTVADVAICGGQREQLKLDSKIVGTAQCGRFGLPLAACAARASGRIVRLSRDQYLRSPVTRNRKGFRSLPCEFLKVQCPFAFRGKLLRYPCCDDFLSFLLAVYGRFGPKEGQF
jgi:hypothetical protein